jgi:MFS family permease
MGGSTCAIGLIPAYETIGFWAPFMVLVLRLLQGLAIGGEFGGAVTFVAEHSPVTQRGFWTSWIVAMGGLGLVVSFIGIQITKSLMSETHWEDWGWRIPFLLSLVLVIVSVIIRKNMSESPLFAKAKAEGKTSLNPLKESFGNKANLKTVLLTVFGLTLGIGVVGYSSTFFLQGFLVKFMFVDYDQANTILIIGITLGVPLYIFFGWLSDRAGRKPILMLSLFFGIVGFRPVFEQIYQTVNLQKKVENRPAMIIDVKKQPLPNNGQMTITTTLHFYTDGTECKEIEKQIPGIAKAESKKNIKINTADKLKLILLLFPLMIIITMSAGPIGAFLVEMFPLKIRYTSMSLPYHVGYGIFGGMSPVIATYLISKANSAHQPDYYLAGLNYAIILMSISLVIGLLYLKESRAEQAAHVKNPAKKSKLKKMLGFIWILLGLIAAYFGIIELGLPKIAADKPDDLIFGIIVTFIVTPIITIGLFTFGKYALQGEYDDRADL